MQALNRLAYRVSVARVQVKWVFPVIQHVLAYYNSQKLKNSILLVDEGYRQGAWKFIKNDQFDFENAVTVYLQDALYVIKYLPDVRVLKYSGVSSPESMSMKEFHDFA